MNGYQLVVIGGSWGGVDALQEILRHLPREYPLAVVAVLHRDRHSDGTLDTHLQRSCAVTVSEAEDKESIEAGHVYLAPADYHLLVEPGRLALSVEAPVAFARPSIDVLFQSAAESYRRAVVGVVLTGASADGADGLAHIQRRGGLTVVQDPATAERRAMPEAAMAAVRPDRVLPIEDVGPFLVALGNNLPGAWT